MNKQLVTKWFRGVLASAEKHSPEILLAIGIGSGITAAVLAVKATPKALKSIDEKKQADCVEELKPIEVVKVAWKPYVPAVATGAFAITCLIGANSVHAKRNAALATAYQLSTTAFNEYREKVVETIGEKKERTVHDNLAKDRITKNPPNDSTVIVTGNGKSLCFDAHSGRYFESDIDRIRRAINDLNYRMTAGMEMSISLNEFYDAIGLPQTPIGNELGWRVDEGLIDIHFSAHVTDDSKAAIVLEYLTPPVYGFNKLY